MRTKIENVTPGENVEIKGFITNIRNKKKIAFLVVKDLSGKIQATLDKDGKEDLAKIVDSLTVGSIVTIEGMVNANNYVKLDGREILIDNIVVESLAEPIPIHEDSAIDVRMDYRWIDLRSDRNTLIFKIQTQIAKAIRDFLLEKGFLEIHSPKIISAASESGADVFELSYFDKKAYLAQSPQFYKQMAMAAGFERIFEIGPVFRAEKSYTNKHTTEFTGVDLEISYIESYRDLISLQQDMLVYMLKRIAELYGEDIKKQFGVSVNVPRCPFPVMSLTDVYNELKKRYGYDVEASQRGDLTTDAERLCAQLAQDMFGSEFIFITNYSFENRAFYHMRDEKGIPMGYDLIWKGVEITTGAQREHRYDVLSAQAREKGLSEDVKNYLDFFRYGCPPHGGFGMGLDRITMVLLGIGIKEAMFLFRGPNRLEP